MKIRFTLVFVACFVIAAGIKSNAQTTAASNLKNAYNPMYPSPTAASLGKYSDIPVSYHTGVPNISVPLYTVTEGSLQLPISLSYHAAGIRVDEVASNVGLGWSLNAGGMISRTVNGGPDEGNPNVGGFSPRKGWGFYKDGGFPTEIVQCDTMPSRNFYGPNGYCPPPYTSCKPCCYYYHDAATGAIDIEPDIYSFNVNGYSGKFFFDANRNVHMVEENDIYVKPINSPNYFSAWMIITPDGVKYYFGNFGGNNATEKAYADPIGLFLDFDEMIANTTWYLTRIESPGGERWITIQYEDEYYSFGNRQGHTYYPFENGGDNPNNISNRPLAVSYVQGKRVKTITTSSGFTTVEFLSSLGGREDLNMANDNRYTNLQQNSAAKSIVGVEITSSGLTKKFNFNQDYFIASQYQCTGCPSDANFDAPQARKRLRLNSVVETDGTNQLPPYLFYYNGTGLPTRYSLGRDAHGYYNGANGNDGWIQNGTQIANYSTVYNTGDNRLPSEYEMKAGVLTVMVHPLGRTTGFEYEGHRYGTTLIGGLRVKTITESDGAGSPITRNFTYENASLYFDNNPNYAAYVNQNNIDYPPHQNIIGQLMEYFSTAPVVPLSTPVGYHIAYDKVTESQAGNGSTIYTYYNNSPQFPTTTKKFPVKPSRVMPGLGTLLKAETKTSTSLTVRLNENQVDSVGTTVVVKGRKAGLVNTNNPNWDPTPLQGWPIYQDYYLRSYRFVTKIEKVTQDGQLTQTTYTYDSNPLHNGPRKKEITDSEGDVNKVEYTYAIDAGSGAPASMISPILPDYKNMPGAVMEEGNYVSNVLTAKTNNTYSQIGPQLELISSKTYPSGTSEFVESQLTYNDAGNIINVYKTNEGVNKGYQWGHNNTFPVAEVSNAQNTKHTIYSYSNTNLPISHSAFTQYTVPYQFTVGSFGTVTLSLGRSTNPGSNNVYADYSSPWGSGTLTLTYNSQCGAASAYFFNVQPGTYTINITIRTTPVNMTMGICGQINYPAAPTTQLTGITEFFYESFEEGSATGAATPHTGKKYLLGDYTNTFTKPNSRTYIIEYWHLSSGTWQYATATYTNGMPLNNGDAIDDVRIYPADAQMKSYTYTPALGMTASIDEKGRVFRYVYDSFGRLKQIVNENGGIEKQYTYQYKSN